MLRAGQATDRILVQQLPSLLHAYSKVTFRVDSSLGAYNTLALKVQSLKKAGLLLRNTTDKVHILLELSVNELQTTSCVTAMRACRHIDLDLLTQNRAYT